ncbi:unnamed protein product [Rotaria sp. Silwood1]|nr:unnamed protein product [Rotaria sp. Silwood1]
MIIFYFDNVCEITIRVNFIYLSKLHSLVFSLVDYVQDPCILFHHIFRLSKLTCYKIIYQIKYDQQLMSIYSTDFTLSPNEYFVFNNRFSIDSGSNYQNIYQDSITLEYFKYVSIKVDNIHFNLFQKLIKYFFRCVAVLRLIEYDPTLSSMANLRIFHLYHTSIIQNNDLIYLLLIY